MDKTAATEVSHPVTFFFMPGRDISLSSLHDSLKLIVKQKTYKNIFDITHFSLYDVS